MALDIGPEDAEWVEALIKQRDAYRDAMQQVMALGAAENVSATDAICRGVELLEGAMHQHPDPVIPDVA